MNFRDYLNELESRFVSEVHAAELSYVKLANDLKEAKQVGTIYHFTEAAKIESIIKTYELRLGNENYISFTRNPNLPSSGHFNSFEYVVRLSFDGDKMSENLKISPIRDIRHADESEEGVLRKVSLKYLKQIDIKPNNIFSINMLGFISDICKTHDIKCNFVKKWEVVK